MWEQKGKVSLWRYTENTRNYPGWHLNADQAGCDSLLELLHELVGSPGVIRTVGLCPPSSLQLGVPNNTGGTAGWLAPRALRLSYSLEPEVWSFPENLEPASLSFGSEWLEPLRKGVAGIPRGLGDYSIGKNRRGNLGLWFWW